MKLIAAFLRLVRWPNLVFIILTQLLFYYCVYVPMLKVQSNNQLNLPFFLLIIASVFIAAAGYIINDYFDVQIDLINKPNRIIIGKFIKRRWAIVWHLVLSGIAILLSLYVSYRTSEWLIVIVNLVCVTALWVYSTTFKRKLLSGNLMIAALTSWVILVVYIFVGANLLSIQGWVINTHAFNVQRLFKFTFLYAGFAFVTTLIREVVKDLEDMDGDRKYDCNTMPIAWGVPASKVFVGVWLVVATTALAIVVLYAWQSGWWAAALYFLILVIAPLLLMLKKLYSATEPKDYHALSNIIKFVMLAGIISMLFLKFTA
jgi:4-hydroxybenzoate polyprenyltransferase